MIESSFLTIGEIWSLQTNWFCRCLVPANDVFNFYCVC